MEIQAGLRRRSKDDFLHGYDGPVVILLHGPAQAALRGERKNAHALGPHNVNVAVRSHIGTQHDEGGRILVELPLEGAVRSECKDTRCAGGVDGPIRADADVTETSTRGIEDPLQSARGVDSVEMTVHVLGINGAVGSNAGTVGNVIAVRLKTPPDMSILAWTRRNGNRNQIARGCLGIEDLDTVRADYGGLRHVSSNERIAPRVTGAETPPTVTWPLPCTVPKPEP